MANKENRMYSRTEVRWPVTIVSPMAQVKGEIHNVSSRGAFVSCQEPLLDGDLFVVIEAPHYKTMSITGKVVWSTILEPGKGDPRIGVGVEFTNMSRNNRQFLHRLIARQYAMKTEIKIDKK